MQQFRASDGACIAFDDEGDGRPLVMLHGLMANRGFFDGQRPLAGSFRLIRPDLRGHGDSRIGSAGASVDRMAEDIAELAVALDLRDAVLVGWSLGASVLWKVLTGPASTRFAGAVVIDMTPRVRNDSDWALGLSGEHCAARSEAIRDDFQSFAKAAGAAIFTQGDEERQVALRCWAGEEFARNAGEEIGAVWASLVEADFRPLLPHILQPTLIVHGVNSHLYGADTADHLVAALPNARAIAFDHSGHSPHIEQPELFNHILGDFANGLTRLRDTAATH